MANAVNFMSDNASGVHPDILKAVVDANQGFANPYGADELSISLKQKFVKMFDHDLDFYLCSTGTCSNSLALSSVTPSCGIIFCHETAHVQVDECGAPELFTGGAKLMLVPGAHGKMDPQLLEDRIKQALSFRPHHNKPSTVTITQSTECGTVYTSEEIAAINKVVKKYGLKLHMDGARFANAVAALGCSPASLTWQAGVDIFSFGATKNGALAAEAIIFFDRSLSEDFDYIHKRSGQLLSKARYFAAQFIAYLEGDLWIKLSDHANKMAKRLITGMMSVREIFPLHPVDANEIFVKMPQDLADRTRKHGAKFYEWEVPGHYRLVTSFATSEDMVDKLLELLHKSADELKSERAKRTEAQNGHSEKRPNEQLGATPSPKPKKLKVLEGPDMVATMAHLPDPLLLPPSANTIFAALTPSAASTEACTN